MDVLLLENNDSYTWNVVDCLQRSGARVRIEPGRARERIAPHLAAVDAVVLGPGPLDPIRADLLDTVGMVVAAGRPLLGICLGHQAIGLWFGARLRREAPAHGLRATIAFRGSRLFSSVAGPATVMRYHSLALAGVAPPLRATAHTEDGIVMAVEHERLPVAGLQFHPDSFATPRGVEMVCAFLDHARAARAAP